MALSMYHIITSSELEIRRVNLSNPDREAIANVLDEALKQNYTKVSVEWVTSPPDLSQPDFDLAAEGICGNTALLDFGDISNLELPIFARKIYNFKQVLKYINRNNNDSFIFGHGIYRHPMNYYLKELVLNTSFPPSNNEEIESKNKSQIIIFDNNKKCKQKKLKLHQLCTTQGTYFLCDGSKTNESILKVCAEGPVLGNIDFPESKRFITSMQRALESRFGSEHFVALGGVYTVNRINNVPWKHRIIRNVWEDRSNVLGSYCQVNAPETMITIFNSSTKLYPRNLEHPIKLNSCQSMHSLSHHSASMNFPVIRETDNWKCAGYFCPATTLYRIDERSQ